MCYCAIELFSPISLSKSFNFPICCMKMMKLEIYEITRGGRNFPKLSGSELPCTDTYQLTTIHGGKLRDSQKMCVSGVYKSFYYFLIDNFARCVHVPSI